MNVGYDAVSFNFFWKLAKTHAAEAGIMVVSAYDYHEKCDDNVLNPWWKTLVPTVSCIYCISIFFFSLKENYCSFKQSKRKNYLIIFRSVTIIPQVTQRKA